MAGSAGSVVIGGMGLTRIFRCWVLLLGLMTAVAQLPAQEKVYSFSTLAGAVSAGHADGNVGTARLNRPTDVAIDQAGNLYVTDTGNRAVRKITPAGIVSTVAGVPSDSRSKDGSLGEARFGAPEGIEIDPAGNLFVADGDAVRRIGVDGQVTTFAGYAGEDPPVSSRLDGTGTGARFNYIAGLGLAPSGVLYVSDLTDDVIRQITPAGVVSTIAGKGAPGHDDGDGTTAGFDGPVGIHVDIAGNVWITEVGNHLVRRMTPQGTVTTFAGTVGVEGDTDGIGTSASLHTPLNITGDLAGNLYVSEFGNQGIRRIAPSGQTTLLAGKIGPNIGSRQGSDDGEGRQASFRHPRGLATDTAGNVFIADEFNNLIRKMTPAGSVSTVAGLSPEKSAGHRDGPGSEARFQNPVAIAVTADGTAYVADVGNHVIRKITPDGTVSTFAGKPGEAGYANGIGSEARFDHLRAVDLDKDGNLYVADANNAVRRITPAGSVSAIAGSNQAERVMINATGPEASFSRPGTLAVGPDGSVYVTDFYFTSYGAGRTALRKISPTGAVTTVQDMFWPHSSIGGMAFAPDGTLYLADATYQFVFKIKPAAEMETVQLKLTGEGFSPQGIAIDNDGQVFLTESSQSGGSRVAQMAADGTIRILGGARYTPGWKDGVASRAVFNDAAGIAVDGKGSLYIACGSNVIRKGVVAGAPVITTQPQGATVAAGSSMQLAVVVSAEPAPTYQWHRNGTPLTGATSATLVLNNVQAADAGSYTVTVSNDIGSVTSQAASISLSAGGGNPPSNPAGGGGGGAPSLWFLLLLAVLGVGRWSRVRAIRVE